MSGMKLFKLSGRLVILFLLCSSKMLAQSNAVPVYKDSHNLYSNKTAALTSNVTGSDVTSSTPFVTDFSVDISMPAELAITKRKINNALFLIKANLGDDY